MNQAIMYIIAAGVVLGGFSWIVNRNSSYGLKFEEGLMMMGPLALSMTGIICLAPILSKLASLLIVPLFRLVGIDPAMLGAILPIDMGGYHIAVELAENPVIGRYSGIIVAAIFGCTVVFTIPVGMGMIQKEDKQVFSKGILIGLITMPFAFMIGGLMAGLGLVETLQQSSFILLLLLLLFMMMVWKMDVILRAFDMLSRVLRILAVLGLSLAAVNFVLGRELVPEIMDLGEAMAVVVAITVFLLGALPISVLLIRVLRKPMQWISDRSQMNEHSIIGLLLTGISVIPVILMIKDMDYKGKLVNVAFMVSSTGMLTAHLAFTTAVEPSLATAVLVSKLVGGVTAVLLAFILGNRLAPEDSIKIEEE